MAMERMAIMSPMSRNMLMVMNPRDKSFKNEYYEFLTSCMDSTHLPCYDGNSSHFLAFLSCMYSQALIYGDNSYALLPHIISKLHAHFNKCLYLMEDLIKTKYRLASGERSYIRPAIPTTYDPHNAKHTCIRAYYSGMHDLVPHTIDFTIPTRRSCYSRTQQAQGKRSSIYYLSTPFKTLFDNHTLQAYIKIGHILARKEHISAIQESLGVYLRDNRGYVKKAYSLPNEIINLVMDYWMDYSTDIHHILRSKAYHNNT